MEDIPDDEQECANWLHKLYQEKVISHLRLLKCQITVNLG